MFSTAARLVKGIWSFSHHASRGPIQWFVLFQTRGLCRPITLRFKLKSIFTLIFAAFSEREPCNVRTPYSGDGNYRECFYAVRYLGHLRHFGKNFYGDRPRATLPSGRGWTRES